MSKTAACQCGVGIFCLYFPPLAIRFRLLKHTRLNVVAFLNELPKTQHDIASFTVDVNTYTVSSCLFFFFLTLYHLVHCTNVSSAHRTRCWHSQLVESSKKVSCVLLHCSSVPAALCCTDCYFALCVFQLLLMQNLVSPPWRSLEC